MASAKQLAARAKFTAMVKAKNSSNSASSSRSNSGAAKNLNMDKTQADSMHNHGNKGK